MGGQGEHGRGGVRYDLACHPDTPASGIGAVRVDWHATDGDDAMLTFTVEGADALVLPPPVTPRRADALWRTTCFEMFWRSDDGRYVEFNFSPSLCWAAYRFDSYRSGMAEQPMAVDPVIETSASGTFALEVDIDFATLPAGRACVGLSAVIEEVDGTKSYWALAHPAGKPDFHHPDCFALELPALG